MLTDLKKRKIVYIMGLGRSGTTLLDIVLGNGKQVFSCGEVCRYPLRRGVRRNTPPGSPRLNFWESVLEELASRDPRFVGFQRLQKLHRRFEYHTGYVRDLLFGLRNSSELDEYHAFLQAFYAVLFEQSGARVLVDSSKYAGRAWHLSRALPADRYEVSYLYVKRNPITVVRSFQKKGLEQSSKNCFSANLLYFLVNTLCQRSCDLLAKNHRVTRVTFEALLRNPGAWLCDVGEALDIELSQVLERIQRGEPLVVGNLFDGNRIRHQEQILLEPPAQNGERNWCDRLSWLVSGHLYRAT